MYRNKHQNWQIFAAAMALTLGARTLRASSLTFTCDTSAAADPDTYAAGTCSYLNSTISTLYTSTFSNINASIYVEQSSTTALGQSNTGYDTVLSYSNYLYQLTKTASSNSTDTSAIAALNSVDNAVYNTGSGSNVVIPSALASAVGLSGQTGVTAGGLACSIGHAGCYNGIIYITTPANLSAESNDTQSLYWRQSGGTIAADQYDVYTILEHETDEILGTTSCVSTDLANLSLQAVCGNIGANTVAAVDLFRYNAAGSLAVGSDYVGQPSAPAGAYFSFDGGVTNGADGAVYNTLSNGLDYADFVPTCTFVQDASGCLGQTADITNDGGAEVNILDAIGYNLTSAQTSSTPSAPEPGTWALFGIGFAGTILSRRLK